MFKLFGKKKPEAEPETQSSPQAQHPEAAALSAQFDPEEFDILAVTGANGFGGDKEPDAEYWTATLPLTAWREGDGPIHQEDTCLVALADDTLLEYLRRRAPRDSIIQARVRQGLEDDRFLLVGIPTPMMDPELKAILDEQKKEVSTWVEGLGTFVLNRSVNWFQTDVDWLGQSIQLIFDRDENQADCCRAARALMEGQADWDQQLRAYAVRELPAQYSQLEELASLPPEELSRRLEAESLQVWGDGRFEFWFHDADFSWEHSVRVNGALSAGPTDIHLEG